MIPDILLSFATLCVSFLAGATIHAAIMLFMYNIDTFLGWEVDW